MAETFKLSEVRPHLRAALVRLLECPEDNRPFVIVEDTVTTRYVQFAGSSGRPLLFDAPLLKIWAEPVRDGSVDIGVDLAIEGLRQLGLPDFAELRILFESSGPRARS